MKNKLLLIAFLGAPCLAMEHLDSICDTAEPSQREDCFRLRSLIACAASSGKAANTYCGLLIKPHETEQDRMQAKIYSDLPAGVRESHLGALQQDIIARGICFHAQRIGAQAGHPYLIMKEATGIVSALLSKK